MKIGASAFDGCTKLTSIEINAAVIAAEAFSGCTALKDVKLGKDVAVIGLPEPRLGEIAAAIVELKEGYTMTQEELERFCAPLPRYKRPRRIIFAEVPRNPTGKIEKPRLREMYCGGSLVEAQITG